MIDDMLIHSETQQEVTAAIDNPTHAVLLQGPAGNGKVTIAKHLVQKILQIDNYATYPYLLQIAPIKGSISVEEIRNLQSFLNRQVPGKAVFRRAVIIADSDKMTQEAQNALLKLLEEPPIDTFFVLTSSYPFQLIPTIKSRVRVIAVRKNSNESIVNHLVSKGFMQADAKRAALMAENNVEKALEYIADSVETEKLEAAKAVLGQSTFERLKLAQSNLKSREQAQEFCELVCKISAVSLASAAKSSKDFSTMQRWARVLSSSRAASEELEKNANVKLVITKMFLSM